MRQVLLMTDADSKGYTVIVPSLPECAGYGQTVDEALFNVRVAIAEHFMVAGRDGALPGKPSDTLVVAII